MTRQQLYNTLRAHGYSPKDVANKLQQTAPGTWCERAKTVAYWMAGARQYELYRAVFSLCCSILGQHGGHVAARHRQETPAEQLSFI